MIYENNKERISKIGVYFIRIVYTILLFVV
jgi:hypothetical protein